MADLERGRVIGHGPCPNCGHPAAYKANKKEHVYVYCVVEGDGGCHSGTQSRSTKGDRELAKRVTKWSSKADQRKFLGEDVLPAKPKAEKPADKPAETGGKSFWDKEIF